MSVAVISACVSSCNTAADPQTDSQPQITTTVTTTTTVPTTTVNRNDEISAILAKLTKEDGTGEINLQMSADEITAVLDKYDIEYTVHGGLTVNVANGGSYIIGRWGGRGVFKVQESYSGLKVGDSKGVVLSIYGQPDEIRPGETEVYVYHQSVLPHEFYNAPINFKVQMQKNIVTQIYIGVEIPYEEIYGAY